MDPGQTSGKLCAAAPPLRRDSRALHRVRLGRCWKAKDQLENAAQPAVRMVQLAGRQAYAPCERPHFYITRLSGRDRGAKEEGIGDQQSRRPGDHPCHG